MILGHIQQLTVWENTYIQSCPVYFERKKKQMLSLKLRQNNMPIVINPAEAGLISVRNFRGTFDADAGHFIDIKTHRRE